MKQVLLLLLLTNVYSLATAQTPDTLRTETTTEDARISAAEVKRFVRYITRADVEERTLFKVGIWPATDRGRGTYESRTFRASFVGEIALERKLSPSISMMIGGEGNFQYATYRDQTFLLAYGLDKQPIYLQRIRSLELSWKGGFRYYHSKAKEIKLGKSANNFSGNYITINYSQPFHRFESSKRQDFNTNKFVPRRSDTRLGNLLDSPSPRLMLAYGIQRRIGRLGYFDFNAGPQVQFGDGFGTSLSFQLNALVGFGW